nr:MAG TPA: hypothetical protein [Caudoviricetes sp.]
MIHDKYSRKQTILVNLANSIIKLYIFIRDLHTRYDL